MPKNIVICSDGTGNTALKGRGTNVFKLFEAVDLTGHKEDPALTPQVAFYDDGVGAKGVKLWRALSGALGLGLSRNVRQLYTELARVYEPDDRIYLFGFSRGAYTVRTLAGLIVDAGVPTYSSDAELKQRVKEAFRKHRRKYRLKGWRWLTWWRKTEEKEAEAVPIQFIGVWDTVDAVGFPVDEIADFWNLFIYPFKFPDFKLSAHVKKACHAIAVDDERHTFHPVMWDESEDGDRIEQVWFSGVHSNVGGGYEKQGLSLAPLDWMMAKAAAGDDGLRFIKRDQDSYHEHQNVNDYLPDSRSGFAVYYRYKPRDIGKICGDSGVKPKIHVSVLERIAQRTDGYAPGNLPDDFDVAFTTAPPGKPAPLPESLKGAGSLLDGVRKWVAVRRFAYHVFVVASVVLVVELWRTVGWANLRIPESVGGWLELGGILLQSPWAKAALAVIVLCFVGSLVAKSRMKTVFSVFWFEPARELRQWLADLRKPGASAAGT